VLLLVEVYNNIRSCKMPNTCCCF